MKLVKILFVTFIISALVVTACTQETVTSPDEDKEEKQQEKKDKDKDLNNEDKQDKEKSEQENEKADEKADEKEKQELEDDKLEFSYPDAVRGIYLTGHTAGGGRFEELVELVDDTDLNSMVIDVKDDYGNITFELEGTEYDDFSRNYIGDPEEMMETLEEHDIYPIARIVVFKDTVLAEERPDLAFTREDGSVWKNSGGEAFVNPFKEEVWEYNLEIAEKAVEMGFQDIQFDYVRFPEGFQTEGLADNLEYSFGNYTEEELTPRIEEEWEQLLEQESNGAPDFTKYNIDEEDVVVEENKEIVEDEDEVEEVDAEELEEEATPPGYDYGLARVMAVSDFTEYAYDRLDEYDVDVSVDVFGYTVTVPESREIGQNFFRILQNVDVISSMIYPSHWGPGYFDITHPDTEPYNLVDGYAEKELELLDKLDDPPVTRPWIQDFTATWLQEGTYIPYGVEEVEAQIRALNENGIEEFLLWNASNQYTKGVDYTPLEDE